MSNRQAGKRPPIAALLIDISGNLHVGSTPTPNAVNAFHRLQKSSVPFRLCSNTSKESTGALIKRLEAMGFRVSDSQGPSGDNRALHWIPASRRLVWTSIGAVAQMITNLGLKSPYLILSDSAREEVVSGIKGQDVSQHRGEQELHATPTYDSVIIGLAPSSFDYATLNTAFRILKGETTRSPNSPGDTNPKAPNLAPLIATHKAKYIQTESGMSLGPGPFVAALENASGVQAHVVGKPTEEFFQMVIDDFTAEELSIPASEHASPRDIEITPTPPNFKGRVAIIGDDVEADLGEGAVQLGLWRILVKTGKYRPGDEVRPGVVPPDEVFDSFAAFVDTLLMDNVSGS